MPMQIGTYGCSPWLNNIGAIANCTGMIVHAIKAPAMMPFKDPEKRDGFGRLGSIDVADSLINNVVASFE